MYKNVISLIEKPDDLPLNDLSSLQKNVRESPSTFSHILIKQLLNKNTQ